MSVYGSGSSGDYGGAVPAGGGYAPAPMQPRVRFEIIGEAWSLFQQQMGTWVLAVLILFGINFGLGFVLGLIGGVAGLSTSGRGGEPNYSPSALFYSLFTNLLTSTVTYFFLGGMYRMALKQLRGQQISVGDLFTAGDVLVPLFLSMFLYTLSVGGGLLLCIVPGFLVGGLMMLASTIIVDKRETSPIAALKASWNALKPEMLSAALFMFVLGLVSISGLIGCGVGLLFTYPLFPISHAILYRDFFGLGDVESPEPSLSGPQNPWAGR